MSRKVVFSKQAQKEAKKVSFSGLKPKADMRIKILKDNPFQNPSPYEKLVGNLSGACSGRINIPHRMGYQIYDTVKIVKVIRMWTHYE